MEWKLWWFCYRILHEFFAVCSSDSVRFVCWITSGVTDWYLKWTVSCPCKLGTFIYWDGHHLKTESSIWKTAECQSFSQECLICFKGSIYCNFQSYFIWKTAECQRPSSQARPICSQGQYFSKLFYLQIVLVLLVLNGLRRSVNYTTFN